VAHHSNDRLSSLFSDFVVLFCSLFIFILPFLAEVRFRLAWVLVVGDGDGDGDIEGPPWETILCLNITLIGKIKA